jgi:glutamyl-Q tRNA(Asp) synthetase
MYVWGVARLSGEQGRVLLRIEDHDRHRSRAAFESAILEDLDWLGFRPSSRSVPVVRQSERGAVYEATLGRLRSRGLVYACSCSRSEIAAGSASGDKTPPAVSELRYPGTCAGKNLSESPGLGLRVRLDAVDERFDDWCHGPQAQRPADQCGDVLVRDREGNWTYQFAAVVDDWAQGVTLVIRGDDLLASTGRQIQLARLIGRPDPPAFLHHPLVMKSPTQKLSKSDGDTGIRDLRAKGWSAEQVIGEAAARVGLLDRSRNVRVEEIPELVRRTFKFGT